MKEDLLTSLRAVFAGRLLTDPAEVAPFLTDWRGKWTGTALAVAQPDSSAEVAALLRWCVQHLVPVVAQGGNTGLSGGATPDQNGTALVLSTARLTRIVAVDHTSYTMVVEAGVTLQQIQATAEAAGMLFPLSLAAEGTCTIGGNLATNAGGVQVLRYGTARELCLGLEVVTADGDIWNGLRALRKDNTGYDLRDLFIGSEGTLGIITGAVLKLHPKPAAQSLAFLAVPDVASALRLLVAAQSRLASALTAFELMSDTCIGLVERHVPGTRMPLAERAPWYVLLEASMYGTAGAEAQMDGARQIEDFLESVLESGDITDAAVSTSLAQFHALWALRENISEAQGAEGRTIKHDISLPLSSIAGFIAETDAALGTAFPEARLVVFGHLGDGNLHYNVSPAPEKCGVQYAAAFTAQEAVMNRLVHDAVTRAGGSISAEHGLGVLRRDEAARYKSAVELKLMRAIKNALDPLNLLNPGKVLP